MKKRNLKVVIAAFVALTIATSSLIIYSGKAHASPQWAQIGNGNLIATKIDGKWMLHSSPATYINMLGVEGKEYKLLNNDAYNLNSSNLLVDKPEKISAQRDSIKAQDGNTTDVIKANGKVFNASEDHSQYLIDGRLVVNDFSNYKNIWTIDSQGQESPLLDETGLDEANEIVRSFDNTKETKGCVVWAYNAMVAGNEDKIVFNSNRNTINAKQYPFNLSIYSVDIYDKSPKLIMDATKYGDSVLLLGAAGNTIAGFVQSSNTLIIYNLETNETKTFTLSGIPTSLSPNGHSILFRKVIDNYVQKDFYVFDTQTGVEKLIGMPNGYFYNEVGSWSPDGSKFAFYMNGFNNNDPSKLYRTNIKIGVIDVESGTIQAFDKPASSNLYPLGSISWVDDKYVIAYTDDNQTWALKVNK